MKRYINRFLLLTGCAVALSACDENSWNDEYLDGFESETVKVEAETIEYTLTAADYKTLAGLSANKALAGDENADALKAVGTQCYFTDVIPAKDYVPAFLENSAFPYFTLPNKSAIKLTYNETKALPEEVSAISAAESVVMDDEDYQIFVWESQDNYVPCFSPSKPASKFLPTILKNALPDAVAGQYAVVNYNEAQVDPVFSAQPEEPDVPGFTLSDVITGAAIDDNLSISGVVANVNSQGFIVTDASGSIFVYKPSQDWQTELKVGSQVAVDGTVAAFNYGAQLVSATYTVEGEQTYTFPAPTALVPSEMDATAAELNDLYKEDKNSGKKMIKYTSQYVSLTGTVAVDAAKGYYNIKVDGCTTAQGSVYGATDEVKAMLKDGETVTLEGFLTSVSSSKFFNICVANVKAASRAAGSRAVQIASENKNALYVYNGSAWTVASDAAILSHADYQAMGQRYDNLSGESPAQLLPLYLKNKYPYAMADDYKFVAYNYYHKVGDNNVTDIRCDYYTYNGSEWILDNGVTTVTEQFVKTGGKWMYDPNVYITLPVGRGIEISTLYFQTCVDWVKANVPDGAAYVSSYGNNEYYCGTSAYQGNVDLRPSAAKAQYAGYDSMSDAEVVALEKTRFESEVFPAALAILHPDAKPLDGIDVLYTINFGAYQGTNPTPTYDIVYKVVGPGQFEFVSCTWND